MADADDRAQRQYANFFASIPNDNTRVAYGRVCQLFFGWCEAKGITDLVEVEPFHVGAYVSDIGDRYEKPKE